MDEQRIPQGRSPRGRGVWTQLAISLASAPVGLIVMVWNVAAWVVATLLILALIGVLLLWALSQQTSDALRHLAYFGLPLLGLGVLHFVVCYLHERFKIWVVGSD